MKSRIFAVFATLITLSLSACEPHERINPQDVATAFQKKLRGGIPDGSYVTVMDDGVFRIEILRTEGGARNDSLTVITEKGESIRVGVAALSYVMEDIIPPNHQAYDSFEEVFRHKPMETRLINTKPDDLVLYRDIWRGITRIGMVTSADSESVQVLWKGGRTTKEKFLPLAKRINTVVRPLEKEYDAYRTELLGGKNRRVGFRKS